MEKRSIIFIIAVLFTVALLNAQNITLPEVPQPVGNYALYKKSGNLIYINQVALKNGKIEKPGVIGIDVTEEEAKEATRQTILNIVSILNQAVDGDLNRVKQAVQLTGIFNTPQGYTQHAAIMNAGSNLLAEILGSRGVHTRTTFGASSLPLNSPVEIQAIFEVGEPFNALYKNINPKEIEQNIFKLLNEDWSVVTSGTPTDYNSMIASWGGFGYIFEQPVGWVFLNANRYTLKKIKESNTFTLCYMDDRYSDQKTLLGSKSGNNSDKMKNLKLQQIITPDGGIAYREAYLIIELRVEGIQEIKPEYFRSPESKEFLMNGKQNGNGKEYHNMVTGIISNVWVKR